MLIFLSVVLAVNTAVLWCLVAGALIALNRETWWSLAFGVYASVAIGALIIIGIFKLFSMC